MTINIDTPFYSETSARLASALYQGISENLPVVALCTAAALAIFGYLATRKKAPAENKDLGTIMELASEIAALKPTIGDAASYPFSAHHGKYINPDRSKAGSLAVLASVARTNSGGLNRSNSDPMETLRLGRDLLRSKSGQCDHMAAAVVAKIVEKIQGGAEWHSTVEVVGNGAHAFVIIGRNPDSDLNDPRTYGPDAVLVDTWLAAVGVNEKYAKALTAGRNGVVRRPRNILKNLDGFGALEGRIKVTQTFTPEMLHEYARTA